MPAINATQLERDRLLRPLLEFVEELPTRLERLISHNDDIGLPSELHSHINTLRSSASKHLDQNSNIRTEDLDTKATNIWNLATRINREGREENTSRPMPTTDSAQLSSRQYVALVRTFAFLLLDAVFRSQQSQRAKNTSKTGARQTSKDIIRLLRVTNKSAKSCIECSYIEYCTKILERGAGYVESLRKFAGANKLPTDSCNSDDELNVFYHLRTEFYALRMTLAWKQDNLDVSDLMFRHANQRDSTNLQPASAEILSDTAFEIGKDLFRKKDYYKASKWLEKAHDVVSSHATELLTFEAEELKFSIMHYLVSALLELNTESDLAKARNLIGLLEQDYSGKMAVPLLRFEFMRKDKQSDTTQFLNVLGQIIRMTHVTDSNFKLVMSCIHELKEWNPEMACRALDDLLNLRLYSHAKDELVHKAFVTRVWITTDKIPNSSQTFESLSSAVECLAANIVQPLDGTVTHAVQILLWKKIDTIYQQEDFKASESWCRLALHRVFSNAGKSNLAKIHRKLLLCKLGTIDYAGAREIYKQMDDDIKREPLTRYIMYKVAIRDHEHELGEDLSFQSRWLETTDKKIAAECLEALARSSPESDSLLYACVIEAQSTGDKQQAILALKATLSKHDESSPSGAHLPSLLRCTARLLISGISQQQREEQSDVAGEICKVFEAAVTAIQKRNVATKSSSSDLFTHSELEWFMKSSYNLCIENYTEWKSEHVTRLLECCIAFAKFHEAEEQSDTSLNLSVVCHGLAAQQKLKLARIEENTESMTTLYGQVRKHVIDFREIQDRSRTNTDDCDKVKKKMLRRLLLNDFEAVIRLEAWQDVTKVVDEWNNLEESKGVEMLADMIMASEAPSEVVFETLDHISKTVGGRSNVTHQSRWLRILYQLSLSSEAKHSTEKLNIINKHAQQVSKTDEIIARVVTLSRSTRQQKEEQRQLHPRSTPSSTTNSYPPEELEYIATTTYNRAVDAYCASDEKECRRLGEQAMQVADELADVDSGGLRRVLVKRMGELLGMPTGGA